MCAHQSPLNPHAHRLTFLIASRFAISTRRRGDLTRASSLRQLSERTVPSVFLLFIAVLVPRLRPTSWLVLFVWGKSKSGDKFAVEKTTALNWLFERERVSFESRFSDERHERERERGDKSVFLFQLFLRASFLLAGPFSRCVARVQRGPARLGRSDRFSSHGNRERRAR